MINNNEINDFIIKVFNYYNGKINVVNKATLDINWCNLIGCNAGGYSRMPNIVVINPIIISRFYENEYNIKLCIIETIIHELYHTDQIINYTLYATDINYNKFIENSCELQTIIYIMGHIQEIYNIFGIYIDIDRNAYGKMLNYYYTPGISYQRIRFHDHVFACIDNLCSIGVEFGTQIYNAMVNAINNNRNIIIFINNEILHVCVNGDIMPIDDFNEAIVKYSCTGLYNADIEFSIKENHDLYITIEIKCMNNMCKKV